MQKLESLVAEENAIKDLNLWGNPKNFKNTVFRQK